MSPLLLLFLVETGIVGAVAYVIWVKFPTGETQQKALTLVVLVAAPLLTSILNWTVQRGTLMLPRVSGLSLRSIDRVELGRVASTPPQRSLSISIRDLTVRVTPGGLAVDFEGRFESQFRLMGQIGRAHV